MITQDKLADLHGMMPDAREIDPIALVTITDDIADNGASHEVVLCMAYGGFYFACLTCEAQGHYEENVPPGWTAATLMDYAAQHGPLRAVVREGKLCVLDGNDQPVASTSLFEPPSTGEITNAAQDWHDEL